MSFFFGFSKEKSVKAAEKYVQQGKLEAAIKEYEKVLEAEPTDLTVHLTLAGLYAQVKRNKDAILKYLKVAENYRKNNQTPQAIALYRKINRLDPSDYGIAMVLADLVRKQGQPAEALQYYLSAAQACRNTHQYVNAVKVLREAVKLYPENIHIQMELAEALFGCDFVDEAHETYIWAGREFYKQGQVVDGLHAFQKALLVKPASKPALKALVDYSLQHGDAQGAVEMLRELLHQFPDDADLVLLLGRTCLSARFLDEAEVSFLRLAGMDSSRYEYLFEVARLFLDERKYHRAVDVIRQCVPYITNRRHKKKATALLKGILEADHKNLTALQVLADIYEQMGEKRNLTTTLNTLVEMALQQHAQATARQTLERLVHLAPKRKTFRIKLANIGPVNPVEREVEVEAETLEGLTNKAAAMQVSGDYSVELLETLLTKNPELVSARIGLLEGMVAGQPESVELRQQLKQCYLDAGYKGKAARQCLELARIHEMHHQTKSAEEMRVEAYQLDPSLEPLQPTGWTSPLGKKLSAIEGFDMVSALADFTESETEPAAAPLETSDLSEPVKTTPALPVPPVVATTLPPTDWAVSRTANLPPPPVEEKTWVLPESTVELPASAMMRIELAANLAQHQPSPGQAWVLPEDSTAFKVSFQNVPEPVSTDSGPVWTLPPDIRTGEISTVAIVEHLSGRLAELPGNALFLEQLELAWHFVSATGSSLTVFKIKVDGFGKNDGTGDPETRNSYLNPIADMLAAEVTPDDRFLAYCGNAEFLFLVTGMNGEAGAAYAERMRGMVEALWFPHPTSGEWVTVSIGVVTAGPFQSTPEGIVAAATLALDLAKDGGGNRFIVSPPLG
ncbi:MAG: tetratricopeptide repeat protein [Blastocatellia bacterium]|nr:tetratricopeptide repeat protein [Blastocatellia bacterium]